MSNALLTRAKKSVCTKVRTALLAVAVASVAGCAGTVIVEFAVDAKITGRDDAGHSWQARSDQFTVLPLPPGMAVSFPAPRYRGDVFEWFIGTSAYGLGGDITNLISSPLCFRFDQVRLSSNMLPNEIRMRVFSVSHTLTGKWAWLGSTDPKKRQFFVPPSLCFPPGKSAHITLGPELSKLFPNQTMFNVRWPEGQTDLIENGVGNWIKIVLPIEYEGKRETLEVTLTAKDSKARISYY